ncbi:DUF354 domain-containing protein [Archaeoglobus neptunius]|uniref:DUF354 domain-containing protein n=1 Tax=Archaeoglobus neptunius TaxID=2798580 RepID=UPI0019253174|nr:DUF354 domain-containing protein [Archaeoglobus neptunius]
MKIMVDVGHPGHVHFYRNPVANWKRNGHEVLVVARDKDLTVSLLNSFGIEHVKIGESKNGLIGKGLDMIAKDLKLLKIARKFKPDILTGIFSPYISQVGSLINRPSVIFNDTEMVRYSQLVTTFASVICTPRCFRGNVRKNIRYDGYQELAYLHPNYFEPDRSVLEDLGIDGERYIVMRLISWSAYHDSGLKGLDYKQLLETVKHFEKYGRVFITSEREINGPLKRHLLKVSPEKIHSVLHHADLYFGEGGTMAVESALLGTPAIHVESDKSGRPTGETSGNFVELRDRYDLLFFYADHDTAVEKATELLESDNTKREWQKKREKLIRDKVDVAEWVTQFVEEYPESFYELSY